MKSLLAFLEEKQYFESDYQLIGFYGTKTAEDYLKQPGGVRTKSREQRWAEKERRKSEQLARLPDVAEDEAERTVNMGDVPRQRRFSRVSRGSSIDVTLSHERLYRC